MDSNKFELKFKLVLVSFLAMPGTLMEKDLNIGSFASRVLCGFEPTARKAFGRAI